MKAARALSIPDPLSENALDALISAAAPLPDRDLHQRGPSCPETKFSALSVSLILSHGMSDDMRTTLFRPGYRCSFVSSAMHSRTVSWNAAQ